MKIELRPSIEALLQGQVDAGHFGTLEEAVAAAVTQTFGTSEPAGDLSWAKPFLEAANRDISAGRTTPHDEIWGRVAQRLTRP
jgi:hypothetical protein